MAHVAVIGGGIAGLSAAHTLHRAGVDVTLLESSLRVGGVIRSERSDGFLVEHGPNSVQTRTPELLEIIADLGLEKRMIEPSDAAKVRYIVRNGVPAAAPTSPPALLSSRLFSWRAKLRLLREPFIPPADPNRAESVADFVRRRFGPEILDYGVNPFVAGIYAGDPEQLSTRHAFPQLYELEQKFGSIIRGQMKQPRSREEKGTSRKMFSFDDGLESLPQAIAEELDERVRTGAVVTAVEAVDLGWNVRCMALSGRFDAVIYCAPLHALSTIALPEHLAFERLRLASYPPLSVVALGYRREEVQHQLDGFGMLVPEKEHRLQILGTLFTSSLFPGRAPEGCVLLTTFVGGMRDSALAQKSSNELYSLVHHDLRQLLGITSQPVFRRHIFWRHSIPQYNLGYEAAVDAMDRLEEAFPGWFMAGNYRSGVAVGDTVSSGVTAARRCIQYLS